MNERRKNISVNILNFTEAEIAGAGVFARNLFTIWLKVASPLLNIEFFASNKIDARHVFNLPARDNISITKVGVAGILSRIFYEQLILPFKLFRTDIYFSPTPVLPFLLKILNPNCKTVITIHDMIPFFVPNKYGKLRSAYVKALSIWGARWADIIVTVSENSKTDISAIAGVTPEKIKVVYNFIPERTVQTSLSTEKYFVSISTIEPGKNIEKTLLAFKRFREKFDAEEFKFYWIGKIGWGYTQEQLTRMIHGYNLQDHFILTGWMSKEEKDSLLGNCMAMVYVSHYEGFGLPVLEALMYGKPSVVSNTSSLPEVIGDAGIVCDKENVDQIANALYEIYTRNERYRKPIADQLKKFDPDRQLNTFLKIIED